MRRFFSFAALALALASCVRADDACQAWPPGAECELQAGETFYANGSTVEHVGVGHYAYFLFTVPTPVPDFIRIVLSAVSGDPDVYIRTDATQQPSFMNWDYSSRNSSTEDSITIYAVNLTAGHEYSLAVHGFRDSQYRLTYVVSDDVTTLYNGVPITDSVAIRAYQYYKFLTEYADLPLTIVLTRLSGDPDLCISVGTTKPTMQINDGTAMAFGDDVVTYSVGANPVGSVYTFGVYGSVNSQYSFAVSQNASTSLLDGVPQAASLLSGTPATFLYLTSGSVDASLALLFSVSAGSLEFFMSSSPAAAGPVYPNRTASDWSGRASYSSPYQLYIPQADANYLTGPGGYYLVVHSTTTTAGAFTNFTVTMKSQFAVSPLQDGEPAFDQVIASHYRYYSFSASNATDVTFDLTPLSGDADMFVSCEKDLTGDDSGTPSRLHSTWSSQLWGEDTLAIPASDEDSCLGPSGGTFYIAVYGFGNSSFSLTAAVDDGAPTRLVIGQPQSGTSVRGLPSLYIVAKPADSVNLTVSVSPSSGDPDLYVTLDDTTPTATNWAYKSASASGSDSITITPSAGGCKLGLPVSSCYCVACNIRISVAAFSARTTYILTVSSGESTVTLSDGVPFRGQVPQFVYAQFRFPISQAGESVSLTLTALSGDPDLTASLSPNPTLSNGTWVSLAQGSDVIIAHSVPIGFMYVSVFGFQNSSFSLTAHMISGNASMQLANGMPQFGSVAYGDYVYYVYSAAAPSDLTFTFTPVNGAVAMYMNTCVNLTVSQCNAKRPTSLLSTWHADATTESQVITVPKDDTKGCGNCLYVIGVTGLLVGQASTFTLVGSSDGSSVAQQLQESVPTRGTVQQWQFSYFAYTFFEANADVIISVTPFAGDPDLYITSCFEAGENACVYQPTNTSYTWRHSSVGADTVSIPASSPGACVPQPPNACTYYIGVQGFTASEFSIVAYSHSDEPVLLVDGRPQNGLVNASVMDQYYMPIPAGTTALDISLIPRSGDSDLFVTLNGNKPTQTVWQYRAISSFGNDNIEIAGTDVAFATGNNGSSCALGGCLLKIAVLGFRDSEYSIVATTSNTATTLIPGVPMRDSVSQGSYDYYEFNLNSYSPISVVLTPLSGDPDLFVDWGSNNTKPTRESHKWASQRVGVDAITIYPSDPLACNTTLAAAGCTYYIGVLGYTYNVSFVLTAYVLDANPVELVDGQPQSGQVPTSLTQQYVFYAPPGFGNVQITLSPSFGDPDLYVSVNTTYPPGPEVGHHDYQALGTFGPDIISIASSDAFIGSRCANLGGAGDDASCPIFIAVNGFTNSSFTLLVSSQASSDLSNGVPLYDAVQHGQFRYYVFRNDDPTTKVSFAVTPYSGDPDIYVSATVFQPNNVNYTWASAGVGRDVVEITSEDPDVCSPTPCNYYVGVTAFTSNASYSIVAMQAGYAVIQLVDGQPLISTVAEGSTEQYAIYVPVGQMTVTISLSPLFGDVDLFVNLDNTPASDSSFQYLSINGDSDDLITITSNDQQYINSPCNPANAAGQSFCVVRIGVQGFSQLSTYSLLASASSSVLLLDGVSQTSSCTASNYTEFIFENRRSTAEVDIVLTPLSGDPDMYISLFPGVNSSNAQWRSTGMGVDVVQIFPGVGCSVPCRYYIGVKGFGGPATFTITGTTASSTPWLLVDGRPQSDFVNTSMSKLYNFDAAANAPFFTIRVAAVYGDPDIYVRLDGGVPSPMSSQYRSLSSSADDSIVIRQSDPLFQNCTANSTTSFNHTRCRVTIAVYGFTASQYSITASLGDNTQQLQEGIPTSGSVNNSAYTFYKFTATSPVPYLFTLTPVNGDPDMYISVTNSTPTLYNNTWFSNGLGTESVTINPSTDPKTTAACKLLPCTFYVGVTGFIRPATYQLAVSTGFTRLLDGSPQQGHSAPMTMTYYLYRADSPGDLSFLITQIQGEAQMFVNKMPLSATSMSTYLPVANCSGTSTSDNPCVPDASVYRWTSLSSFDRSSVTIAANDPNACLACYYVIGMLSNSATASADFSLVVASANAIIVLADGVPHSDVVPKGAYEYYRMGVTQVGVDVEIIVTPFYGDPDVYVSWDPSNSRPNATHNNAMATSQYNDTVYLQSSSIASCVTEGQVSGTGCQLYVSVFGFSNASYTIVSRLNDGYLSPIVLRSGVPQSMTLAKSEWAYFSAYVNVPAGTAYSFSLVSSFGDTDMYITTGGDEGPSQSNFNFSSSSANFDSVIVDSSDPHWCTGCTLIVGVLAFQSSQFTLTYSTNTSASVVPLRDGVPTFATVSAGSFKYFKLYVDAQTKLVTIALSALSGTPQAFVLVESTSSTGQYLLPTLTRWTWSSISQGSLLTVIRSTDMGFFAPATYVIGVHSASTSAFFVTSTISRDTMTALGNGQPQVAFVAADSYAYFTFTTGGMPPVSINVRVSNPALLLYAVDNYDSANPASLPSSANYNWSSLVDYTSQSVLSIPSANVSGVFYTIGVYSSAGATFSITASTNESIITLIPGGQSSRFSIAQNVTQHFRVDITDVTKDLVIAVSSLSGDADVVVARSSIPYCEFPGGVTPSPYFDNSKCYNFTWKASTPNIDLVHIAAADPCANADPHSGCSASDWGVGAFYVGVFAYVDTVFDITVYSSGGVTTLVDGSAQVGATSNAVNSYFLLQVSPVKVRPSLRFDITAFNTSQADGSPSPLGVQLYLSSCHSGSCTAANAAPSNAFRNWTQYVPFSSGASASSVSLFIVDADPNYCDPGVGGVCNYYITVAPAVTCTTRLCLANFMIRATVLDGSGLQSIRYSDINNTLYSRADAVPVDTGVTRYELWVGNVLAPPPMYFELDACTGPSSAMPAMSLCTIVPGQTPLCPNPSNPSNAANAGKAVVVTTSNGGTGSYTLNSPKGVVYAAVVSASFHASPPLSGGSMRRLSNVSQPLALPLPLALPRLPSSQLLTFPMTSADQSSTYVLKVSVGAQILRVFAPDSVLAVQSGPEGSDGSRIMGFEVTWAAAMLYSGSTQVGLLTNVQYSVYYTANGFATTIQPSTVCGLAQSGASVQVLYTGTHFIADNLSPNKRYEVNVVAYCGPACAAAVAAANPGAVLLDTYAYRNIMVTTPESIKPKAGGNSVGVTVLIVVLVIIGVGVAAGLVIYWQRKRAQRLEQYEMVDVGEHAGTYATTGDVYSAMD